MKFKRHWQIWQGLNPDDVIFKGSHTVCLKYYKQHGGGKADLHIGYEIY
jgi:hypothetical protein